MRSDVDVVVRVVVPVVVRVTVDLVVLIVVVGKRSGLFVRQIYTKLTTAHLPEKDE